jgi:hypothetical protein
MPDLVDVFQKLRELRKNVEEALDDNDAEFLPSVVSSEGFENKLESNLLQDPVKQVVSNNCPKKLGDLRQVLGRVSVQKAILVKEAMEHTSVDFLFFDDLRLLEVVHGHNQLFDSCVDVLILRSENYLEVLICCCLDLL